MCACCVLSGVRCLVCVVSGVWVCVCVCVGVFVSVSVSVLLCFPPVLLAIERFHVYHVLLPLPEG